jgi:hypothetical protein
VLNGHPEYRLPNTLNVAFPNHVGADILARLDGVAALDRVPLAVPGGSNYRRCSRQWVFDPRSAWGRSASAWDVIQRLKKLTP